LNSKQLLLQAVELGVTFISGDHFYASSPQQNLMRLSFTMAGRQSIEDAVKRLGQLMKSRLLKIKKQPKGRTDGLRALV
jgi:2-aminoadipate transaminase